MTDAGFDIAIIGGGAIGLSLARALCAEGADVAVIDAAGLKHGAISPATRAAAGMLAPSFEYGEFPEALGKALYLFSARGLALWRDFAPAIEEETGVFIDYRTDGMLGVAFSEDDAAPLQEQARLVSAHGGAAEMISGEDARELEPALSKEVTHALHAPEDAQVDPRRLLDALKALLMKKAKLIPARAVGATASGAGHKVTLEGGETVFAKTLVIASGAASGVAPKGLVHPVKGEATSIAMERGLITRVIRAPGAYLCPKADGRLVIGATEALGRDDLEVEPEAVEGLKTSGARAVPALGGAKELERWAGLRPGTPDSAPILGTDAEGRFLALGHYRNGILHAPAAAEAMAALILGRAPPFDIAPFASDRF